MSLESSGVVGKATFRIHITPAGRPAAQPHSGAWWPLICPETMGERMPVAKRVPATEGQGLGGRRQISTNDTAPQGRTLNSSRNFPSGCSDVQGRYLIPQGRTKVQVLLRQRPAQH